MQGVPLIEILEEFVIKIVEQCKRNSRDALRRAFTEGDYCVKYTTPLSYNQNWKVKLVSSLPVWDIKS